MEFRILDLFSGAGGFSSGFEKHKDFTTVLANDFNRDALETFKYNFKNTETIYGDITEESVKGLIIEKARKLRVNMIIGGPPCQGFSLKGKKLGMDDPRNFLFLEFYNIVVNVKPEIFVIENVKHLLHSLDGYFIEQIRSRFSDLGYYVNYGFLNAKDFGVPQNRERTIIIGSLSKNIELPNSSIYKNLTVRDAISDISYLESGEGDFKQRYKEQSLTEYQKELRSNSSFLYNHVATNHSELALEKLSMIPPEGDKSSLPKKYLGKQKFSNTWSRLKWDDVSPTIDTRFDTPSNGRNSHPYLNRAITPREAARLQSFDDNFIFQGKKTQICKQIGNAVPPRLAHSIAIKIADTYKVKSIISNNFTLYNDDAYRIIKEFKNNNLKVSHIITDPPYNISKKNNFSTMNNPRKGIDFGEWDKDFNLLGWIGEYSKLLDKNGSFIIFCSYFNISYIIDELKKFNIVTKDILIWKKTNPMPRNTNRRYVQDMEFAIWGVKKGAKWIFNKPPSIPYLRSLFESSTVSGHEKVGHPTQKSEKILSDIIEIHTNENDIILDPFMGSGTTGISAIKKRRKFLGVEISSEYFNLAKNRMKEYK